MGNTLSKVRVQTRCAIAAQKMTPTASERDSPQQDLLGVATRNKQHHEAPPVGPIAMPRTPKRKLTDYPKDVLSETLHHLPAGGLQSARLACKALAAAGKDPALPGWEELLQTAVSRANTPHQAIKLLQLAADRGVLQHVEQLDLSGKGLLSYHVEQLCNVFAGLKTNKLQRLNLSNNRFGALGAQAIAAATHLTGLQHLDLGHNFIGNAGAKAIAEAKHLAALQHLNLCANRLDAAGAEAVAAAKHLTSLRDLDLQKNAIGNAGATAIAEAQHLAALQYLNLSHNLIGDAGAEAIAAAQHLAGLRGLALSWNELGDVGAKAIAAAKHLVGLQELILSWNQIGAAGALAILAAKHLVGLRHLNLWANTPLADISTAIAAVLRVCRVFPQR